MQEVKFSYGVMGDTLERQANEQGLTLGKDAEILERVKKAINMCGYHVATDSQVDGMTKKLHKRVMKILKAK